jgi:DNA topoisomerase-2
MDLAFNKKRADDRKTWLTKYDRSKVLRGDCPTLTHRDFVDYELIHFSNYDLGRSLPSAIDGLKVSQRKIMMLQEKLTTEIASRTAGWIYFSRVHIIMENLFQGAIVALHRISWDLTISTF